MAHHAECFLTPIPHSSIHFVVKFSVVEAGKIRNFKILSAIKFYNVNYNHRNIRNYDLL